MGRTKFSGLSKRNSKMEICHGGQILSSLTPSWVAGRIVKWRVPIERREVFLIDKSTCSHLWTEKLVATTVDRMFMASLLYCPVVRQNPVTMQKGPKLSMLLVPPSYNSNQIMTNTDHQTM